MAMDLSVRRVGNGYVIKYHSSKEDAVPIIAPDGVPPEIMAAVRELSGRVPLEWYCATLPQVEIKVAELIRNYFAGKKLVQDENEKKEEGSGSKG